MRRPGLFFHQDGERGFGRECGASNHRSVGHYRLIVRNENPALASAAVKPNAAAAGHLCHDFCDEKLRQPYHFHERQIDIDHGTPQPEVRYSTTGVRRSTMRIYDNRQGINVALYQGTT